MYHDMLAYLSNHIRRRITDLKTLRYMCVKEMLATILMTVVQISKYCHKVNILKKIKFIKSTNFHKIFMVLNTFTPTLMAKPIHKVSAKTSKSTNFGGD